MIERSEWCTLCGEQDPNHRTTCPNYGVPTNEAFELWWKENFGRPKNVVQAMTKSTAFHAWVAGRSKAEADHTKEVMLHAVTKFELEKERSFGSGAIPMRSSTVENWIAYAEGLDAQLLEERKANQAWDIHCAELLEENAKLRMLVANGEKEKI